MSETIEFSFELPVYPERVYRAWLDSGEHSRFTSLPAQIDPKPGGSFSSLDGGVTGTMRTITPVDRIVQSWTIPAIPGVQDSLVELRLTPTCTGCDLKLTHTGIADGKSRQVLAWWENTYFRPLKQYFDGWVGEYVADMGDG